MSNKEPNLLSSDKEQIEWAKAKGIKPHKFAGSIDRDCKECGYSVYFAIHTDAFPRL